MTTLLNPANALTESERIIFLLEQRRAVIPRADELLLAHRPMHDQLEHSTFATSHAVDAWRAALAQRWEYEVAARRLYKQVYQQCVDYYGSTDVPQVQVFSCASNEAHSTPSDLLADLRRMEAALTVSSGVPFARQRLAELARVCAALEYAIDQTHACETERRSSVLAQRMTQEAYRRLSRITREVLAAHVGDLALLEELDVKAFSGPS